MNKHQAEEKIKELTKQINHYNKVYFQQNQSEISDYAFDQLLNQLTQLERKYPSLVKKDSPTQRVGERTSSNFATVKHQVPMLSLTNSYSTQDLQQFINRVQKFLPEEKISFYCELKFDGVAISLLYKNKQLHKILTRGDGRQGDDITAHVATITNLPLRINHPNLPINFEIRGEAYMTQSAFETLNKKLQESGKDPLANPRNTASGTLKTLNINSVADRKLNFYPYALLTKEASNITTQEKAIHTLSQCGFNLPLNTTQHCNSFDQVIAYITYWEKSKHTLGVNIDGVVIKVNSLAQQVQIGATAKSPRWAIAYKYKPENITTTLKNVTYQIGRTGIITPVGEMSPVELAGTQIKRVSLHNKGVIHNLNLHIGDTVYIEKGGDIIPKITGVNIGQRPHNTQPITFPTKCPSCKTCIIQNKNNILSFCPNYHHCPDQLKNKLAHFVSRKALDIQHIGPKTINLLFEKNLVTTPLHLYQLQAKDLHGLEGFQQKSIQNLLQSIKKSLQAPFEKVLFALGIPHIGQVVADKLATHFQEIDRLKQATLDQLIVIPEIGKEIAESIINYLKDDINQQHIQQLQSIGLSFESKKNISPQLKKTLANKTIVITGTFQSFSRQALQHYTQNHGARLLSNISKQVDYLVAGEKPGSKKIQQAQALHIPIIGIIQLQKIIEKKEANQ